MSVALQFSITAVPSTLRVAGGRDIPFVRAILSLRNTGNTLAAGVVPHATLSEERGLVHDATGILGGAATGSIPPGGELHWDVYDVLLAAHPGVASKIHLWGYKAVLNWWIDFSAWAEYGEEGAEAPIRTGITRWRLRWNPEGTPEEKIELSMEAVEGG
ncbi:MAG TPA: hypothetical protein VFG28_05090 [Syntrophales bacterium]|nr:hypothetical protein [Syntrophales bacterium]